MIRRPKPDEDEEELLQLQEEFLLAKTKDPDKQPAAQVTRLQKPEAPTTKRVQNTEPGTRKASKFAQAKGLKNHSEKRSRTEDSSSSVFGDILEKHVDESPPSHQSMSEDDKVYFPAVVPSVLGNIKEKNVDPEDNFDSLVMPSKGFPEVTKRNLSVKPNQSNLPKQPLEEADQEGLAKMEVDVSKLKPISGNPSTSVNIPNESYGTSSKEADEIHGENLKLLSSMSQKDILEEQQKLLTSLDPQMIEFIKARRQETVANKPEDAKQNSPEKFDSSSIPEAEDIPEPDYDSESWWENDVFKHPKVKTWLHFGTVETDKFEWMQSFKDSRKINPSEPYEARFDFSGYLLPYTFEYTEQTKTLFHHGEEPLRPGYSLKELISLSRSSVIQHRVMALNTFAGILEFYNTGSYKDVLELPLSKIFFIIRIAMDENKSSILEAALKAMRNLLYNKIDEASLEALIGLEDGAKQPFLENDKTEIAELDSKESELKDFHLAEIDLISAALRTDILQRLYYILDTIKPNFNSVQYSLQILTRLARDSLDTSMKIVQKEHLITTVIENFVPIPFMNLEFFPQLVYNRQPVLAAIRFLRVLCVESGETGKVLLENHELLCPIYEYVVCEVKGTHGLRLQIEAYCLLSNLLNSDSAIAIPILPNLLTTLCKHVEGTDIYDTSSVLSATHAAALLQLLNTILRRHKRKVEDSDKAQIYQLVILGTKKWTRQVSKSDSYSCAHLRLVCAAMDCSRTSIELEDIADNIYHSCLKRLLSSHGLRVMLKNLIKSSNLLSGLDTKNLFFNKNLMSLGSSVVDAPQKVLPILSMTSPLPFLASLFRLLIRIQDVEITDFLTLLAPYLKKLVKKTPSLADNWFTRMEIDFVINIVKLATKIDIEDCEKGLVYDIANKLCYILRGDKTKDLIFLFTKIVFNKNWFTAQGLFHLLNLSEGITPSRGVLEEKAQSSLEMIILCYDRIMRANNVFREEEVNLYLRKWKEPLLPRDWVYMPILILYSGRGYLRGTKAIGMQAEQQRAREFSDLIFIVTCTLEWILFYETCFPELLKDIDVTDRFCRVMCVFLCDDSLFLEPSINKLLQKCTQVLFKKNPKFDFDKEMMGLHNFEDFYTELVQQYQAVSYGDPTFAACVVVPLAQKHNVKWRQLVWYEYVGCLRYLDCPPHLMCYHLKDYLHPDETDERMLQSYHKALTSKHVKPGTLAHEIAEYHMKRYKERMSQKADDATALPAQESV